MKILVLLFLRLPALVLSRRNDQKDNGRLIWNEAKRYCENNSSSLVTFENEKEVKSLVKNQQEDFWIGLYYNATEDKLVWIDNKSTDYLLSLMKNEEKACFYFHPKEKCALKHHKLNITECFKESKCDKKRHFLCKPSSTLVHSFYTLSSYTAKTPKDIQPLYTTSAYARYSEINPTSSIYLTIKPTILISTSEIQLTSSIYQPKESKLTVTSISKLEVNPTSSVHQGATSMPHLTSILKAHSSSSSVISNQKPSSVKMTSVQLESPLSLFLNVEAISSTKGSSLYPSTIAISSKSPQEDKNMVNHFHEVMAQLNTSDPDCMAILVNEYEKLMKWTDRQDVRMDYNPMMEAQTIEKIALEFTRLNLNQNRTSVNISNKEIAFHAKLVPPDIDSDVVFPDASKDPDVNTISLPKSLFQGQEQTYIVNVVFKNNKTISKFTPKVMEGKVDKKKWIVNTEIFSSAIFPKKKEPFEDVKIKLYHVQDNIAKADAIAHCSFWNFSISTSYNGSWSKRGCDVVSTTDTYTVCACNHLTNFAVLMQITPGEKTDKLHQEVLSFITYIGLALSLIGEAITIVLYYIFLNKRHEKIQIRVNLLCTLAAAQIVFLAGIDQTQNKDLCVFVAATIHFFYLASFCWMMMEGVYLYRMVVKVFDAHMTIRYSYLFAYGFPLSVVAVSMIIALFQSEGIFSYISSNYCWFGFHNQLIWSFVGPVLLLIAINSFFLFSAMKEMVSMRSVKTLNSFELSSIRASARACVVLLPLLGITWVFGLLGLGGFGVEWQYVFTVLNTTQGFMIFLFHCVRNTELRAAIELRYFQWESNHSIHSNRGRVTPSKDMNALAIDDSDKRRSNSIPMTTKENKVMPEPNAL